jgi:glutathione S-transferase
MSTPVLWQIEVSHFSEKVRWALDHKGIEHDRKTPPPPVCPAISLVLNRGRASTFPVLQLDDTTIVDSTAIIAALERRYPDPPLYPASPSEREQALALEEHFDEELGRYSRLLAFHFMLGHPPALEAFIAGTMPAKAAANATVRAGAARGASVFLNARYRVSKSGAADESRAKVLAAMDRLDAELERSGGPYLVGDTFTVADLTAASLFVPIVHPPEGPDLPDPPPDFVAFVDPLRDRPGFVWVQDTFARHRQNARRP